MAKLDGLDTFLDDLPGTRPSRGASTGNALVDYLDTLENQPAPAPPPAPAGVLRTIGDMGIKAAQGVIDLGQSVVGAGSLATGGLVGKGMRAIGYDPERAKDMIGEGLSDAQKASEQKVQSAEGFGDTVMAAVENPRAIAGSVVESLPAMLAAGGISGAVAKRIAAKAAAPFGGMATAEGAAAGQKALEAAAGRLVTTAAGAEGAQTAGQIADQAQGAGRTYGQYAVPAIVAGLGTAAIGKVAGKVMGDAETALFTGAKSAGVQGSLPMRMVKGVVGEGLLEEAPQSAQEQVFTNMAMGDPLSKGVGNAAGMGLVTGGVMGAAMGAISPHQAANEIRAAKTVPEVGTLSAAANIGTEAQAQTVENSPPVVPEPQEPAPVDPVMEQILTLKGKARSEALAAYAMINRPDVPKGVRQYNSKLLDHHLGTLDKPDTPLLTYDTTPTGVMVAGPDGVRAETRADLINRAQLQSEQDAEAQRRIDLGLPARTILKGTTNETDANRAGDPAAMAAQAIQNGDGQPAEVAGQPIDKDWTAFAPESGTLNVPRADMPQVKAEHRGALVNFLKVRGVEASQAEEVPASSLKPTQGEFSPAKVLKAEGFTGTDRSILVSSDGHVLDGHHQWLAKLKANAAVKVIKLDAPIADLITTVKEFPSASAADGATQAQTKKGQFASAEEAQAYISQQRRSGGSRIEALPVPLDDGSFRVALKDSEDWAKAQTFKRQQELAAAGMKDGDIVRDNGEPFLSKKGAQNAIKKHGADYHVVAIKGGFVLRKEVIDAPDKAAAPAVQGEPAADVEVSAPAQADAKAADAKPALKDPTTIEEADANWEAAKASGDGEQMRKAAADLARFNAPDEKRPPATPKKASKPAQEPTAEAEKPGPTTVDPDQDEKAPQWPSRSDLVQTGEVPMDGWAKTGTNVEGNALYERDGQRRVLQDGYVITEADGADADKRVAEFRTKAEVKALAAADKKAAEPVEKKTTPPADPKPATLTDAGEKIGGARKDRWKERGLNVSDLDAMGEGEGAELATKANVWKPDYEAMVKAGAEPLVAAQVKIIYDRLAAKPKVDSPAARRQYVTMMQHVREAFGSVKTEAERQAAYMDLLYDRLKWTQGSAGDDERAKRNATGIEDLAAHQKEARGLLFSVYKGRSDPFYLYSSDKAKAARMVADGFPAKGEPWKARFVIAERPGSGLTPRGVELMVDNAARAGTPVTEEQVRAGVFMVLRKANSKVEAVLPTRADAEAAAKAVYDRDKGTAAGGKPEPVRPNLDSLQREGLPVRIDRDVTTEDFLKDFGFRGVEFGNWSAQDERQRIINMAYDGLADLAEVMGVPKKAMSLNGTLGMAFGARGGGKFAAHYEPGKLVINMTKINGGGSMAHEWAHALDHYFGEFGQADAYTRRARGVSGWYTPRTYNGTQPPKNLRPEMAAAFDGIMQALFQKQITKAEMVRDLELKLEKTQSRATQETGSMREQLERSVKAQQQALEEARKEPDGKTFATGKKSDYAAEAQKLSGKSTDGYWQRPTEMFARAFESWVFDRMTAMGAKSDYLVHGVEADRFAGDGYKGNPYPAGAERAQINAAFDNLTSVMQTKPGENGKVVLLAKGFDSAAYRRHFGVDAGMSVTEARKITDRISAKWTNGPRIVVVNTARDLPEKVDPRARGLYTGQTVYIVASNNKNADYVARTLAHEAIAHYGLRNALGPQRWGALMAAIQRATKSGNKDLIALKDYVERAYADENLSPNLIADEIAARAVEQGVDPVTGEFRPGFAFLKQVYARVAEFLRSLGINVAFTMAELQGMLSKAMAGLEAGKRTEGGGQLVVSAAARSDTPVTVPPVMIGSGLGTATKHPDYAAAKAGDKLAAVNVAKSLVTDGLVEQVRAKIGDTNPIVVPVLSEEATGRNQIPVAAALMLSNKLGLQRTAGIVQTNRPHRTTLSGLDRIFAGPEFEGKVEPGRNYLLVDDTLTQGATFAALASHIEDNGGIVVGAVALTGKQYSADLQPTPETLAKLREKHGDLEQDFRAATGYGFDALTQSEARYLASFEPAQSVRDRIAEEAQRAVVRRDAGDSGRAGKGRAALDPSVEQTDTPAFKRWFGDSKVVDADGKPLVVYHGTTAEFNEFKPGKDGGIHFGDEAAAGWRLADQAGFEDAPGNRVVQAYLAIQNPKALSFDPGTDAAWAKAIKEAKAKGHDGISYPNETEADPDEDNGGNVQTTSWVAFRPEQIKSAIGNNGNFDGFDADVMHALGSPADAMDPRDAATFTDRARNAFNDLASTQKTFGWWNKTIGTQYQKAAQDKHFKRVYDATQDYILDVSRLANDSADRARDLLPRLESLGDVLKDTPLDKGRTTKADVRAISKPIFQGTLVDKRRYGAEELKRVFKLTDKQIDLYRQFRSAVDKSLDDLTTSTAAKLMRYKGFTDEMKTAVELGDHEALANMVETMAKTNPAMKGLSEQLREISDRAKTLKAEGYAPLMRFGQYAVSVRDPKTNELQAFYLFESEREANKKARELEGTGVVDKSVMATEDYKLLRGVSPESLELFGDILAKSGAFDAKDEVFQEYLRRAVDQRSAMKRMIQREGYPGYSQDVRRVLATFVTSNARLASKNLHFTPMLEAVENIPKTKGDVRDEATRLVDYVQNPVEEASKIRGLLFAQYIGGSVASAMVNMTQSLTMTLPYLSQFSNPAKAASQIAGAMKQALGKITDQALAADLAKAEQLGVVSPQEIHHLNAEAMATFGSNPAIQKVMFLWGGLFSLAEQYNRRVAFIAAWQGAKERGVAEPYAAAAKAVEETQGVYNKGNRPDWARGALGATLFTFKQFSISYLEFLSRLPTRERVLALAILMLASGAEGLPFADDLDDVIDSIAQRLGYNFNSKQQKRQFIGATLGQGAADFLLKGVSSIPGMPIDIAGRMGMANLIPGSGILRKDVKDHMQDVLEIAGPAGGVVRDATQGQFLPVALRNLVKATDMFQTGMYRDQKGRRVIDTDAVDAVWKGIGFQPVEVARESATARLVNQSVQLTKDTEGEIAADMAEARFENDREKLEAARQRLRDWNEKNPDTPISINSGQVNRRVREMRLSRADRMVKNAPKELRAEVRSQLQ